MSSTDNKGLVRRYYAEYSAGRGAQAVDDLFADDFVFSHGGEEKSGLADLRERTAAWQSAVSDLEFVGETIVAEGDLVAVRGTARFRHTGMLMGIEPTGKELVVRFVDFWRVAENQIVEGWLSFDQLDFLVQLGVVDPAPKAGQP